jgi:hypothetical protein
VVKEVQREEAESCVRTGYSEQLYEVGCVVHTGSSVVDHNYHYEVHSSYVKVLLSSSNSILIWITVRKMQSFWTYFVLVHQHHLAIAI